MRKVRFCFFAFLAILALGTASAQAPTTGENPRRAIIDTKNSASSSIDSGMVYLYMSGFGSFTPLVMTYVNNDGSVSISNSTDTTTEVYEYSADLRYIKTMRFQNEFSTLGAFAKDNQGNYYFLYGKDVKENQKNVENISLVKYDSSGRKVNTYRLKAFPDNSNKGIREPFLFGACKMEISGNMLVVYFARQMFQSDDGKNHQASWGFVIDKDTFARVDVQMPYVSHSFDQFILPINNGFIFADQGDAYPRGFAFAKVQAGQATKSLNSFRFKESKRYQTTYAQLGGLVETSDGYLFAGTYEKNSIVSDEFHNDSRNVFVLTLDNELNTISQPIWITNYRDKNNENAAYPKIVALDTGRFLIMWELMGNSGYRSTYMTIIDKTGKLLTAVKELPGIRLSINDVIRYNRTNRNVYWAVDNEDKNINVFSFNPDNPINIPVRTGAPGGAYGMTLRSFTVNKTLVSQRGQFTVQATIRNSVLAAFPGGQIGAALVDNSGNIVEVVGMTNINALNSGQLLSNRTVSCTVLNTVKPGQYRLRIVIRPTGGEWRVATMTAGSERRYPLVIFDRIPNAIPITVTDGGAMAVTDGGAMVGSDGLVLEKFTVNKTQVPQNQLLTVQANIKNQGPDKFPGGQLGSALVNNNGDIVEVIGAINFEELNSGSSRTNRVVYCAVPNTVRPGQYSLRMVIRTTGGEWRLVSLTGKNVLNAIPVTVTAGEAMIGGYGLALTQFTVNDRKVAVSVSQGAKFSVYVRAIKVGLEAFPGGQIGVALVGNNDNIVEIINTIDWKVLDIKSGERSQDIKNISVPNSVALGRYNLRLVVRPTGGEWRIVTMSADGIPNSFDFTVR